MYIVISISEDGVYIESVSKGGLEERLNAGYWGDCPIHGRLPDETDPNYYPVGIYIIEGSLIQPKKVEVVTKYEI